MNECKYCFGAMGFHSDNCIIFEVTDPKDVCQSCSHPTHSGQCEVIKIGDERCECLQKMKCANCSADMFRPGGDTIEWACSWCGHFEFFGKSAYRTFG